MTTSPQPVSLERDAAPRTRRSTYAVSRLVDGTVLVLPKRLAQVGLEDFSGPGSCSVRRVGGYGE